MPTSLIAPVVSAGVSYGASKLFGGSSGSGSSPLTSFSPSGFYGGGLTGSFDANGNSIVTPSPDRLAAVGNVAGVLGTQADQLGALRASVAPGISGLRASRLMEIENARRSAVGNLRENLQRRRVLGSSFGQDAISRAESTFGEAKGKAAAESYLQELEASTNLLNQEFTARRAQFQTGLDEMNLEANIAAGLSGKATDVLGQNARTLAALNAKEAEASGSFFGKLVQPVASAAGKGVGDFFSGLGGGGGGANSLGGSLALTA